MPFANDVFCYATGTTVLNSGNSTVLDNVESVDVNADGSIGTGDTFNGETILTLGYASSSGVDCDGNPILGNGGMYITTDAGNTYFIHKDGPGTDAIVDELNVSIPINNQTANIGSFYLNAPDDDVVFCCFTSGTLIKTRSGEVAIEDLSVGDMVLTMDHGYQPIRWIGSNKVKAEGSLAPIVIRKDTLGNDRDLKVSPQHRMLLQGWQADLMFGSNEVLATAKSLINDSTIFRLEGGEVEYFHILFDTHEIVWANGCPSESFHPGEQGMNSLEEEMQSEIYALFPELEQNVGSYGPSARLSLKRKEATMLAQVMLNGENTAQKEMI